MHQALGMDRGNCPGDHFQQPGGIPGGVGNVEPMFEGPSRDVLKDQVQPWAGLAGFVQRHDVGVAYACIRSCLAQAERAARAARGKGRS